MFKHISELKIMRDALSAQIESMEADTMIPVKNQRVISRTAKTVECGMAVEFPSGWAYCSGVSHMTQGVTMSSVRGDIWNVPFRQRVRTKRGL